MKTIVLSLGISMMSLFAAKAETSESKSLYNQNPRDCTASATRTASADVTCPDGTIITISASVTRSATAATCEEAAIVAVITADVVASQVVNGNVEAKNYICP
ncbi:hypothetical protein C7T94_03800 [Pedobacter yulinensis]|uniref:Uncharacterized protein n=1 Tax=Pedobacter yulinensis TaxID=2126353 RepID=A0A2T3HS78_9SPHI|nr:hypothetical protein [Pedobacter yulinensis]PST85237.1 hypothetical protein C7T94_03800 [Pedobacter yulinensis]